MRTKEVANGFRCDCVVACDLELLLIVFWNIDYNKLNEDNLDENIAWIYRNYWSIMFFWSF